MLGRILRALINIIRNLDLGSLGTFLVIVIGIIAIVAALIIIIAPFVIAALVNFLISWQMSTAVKMKGHNFFITFFMCFLLGIPGYFYAIALPDVTKQHQLEKIINTLQKAKTSSSEETEKTD